MEVEKTMYLSRLYDFYGDLLTDKQREYMELYYEQDLSLGEIAEELTVSRQAVYDNIKRSELLLTKYEAALQLVAQFHSRQKAIKQLEQYVQKHYEKDNELHRLVQHIEDGE